MGIVIKWNIENSTCNGLLLGLLHQNTNNIKKLRSTLKFFTSNSKTFLLAYVDFLFIINLN